MSRRTQRRDSLRFEILTLAVQSHKCLSVYPGVMSPAFCNIATSLYASFRLPIQGGAWHHMLTYDETSLRPSDSFQLNARLSRCLKLELGPNGSPNNKQSCTPFKRDFRGCQRPNADRMGRNCHRPFNLLLAPVSRLFISQNLLLRVRPRNVLRAPCLKNEGTVQYPGRNKTCTVNVRAQGFGLMRARPDHAEMCLPSTCRSSLSTLFVDCQLRDPTDFEFGIDLISFCRQHSTPL